MGTDVDVRNGDSQQLAVLTNDQLQYIARTEFVPPGLRGNLPAILACVATGRAIGIADMTALRSIHIIDGKATFSAELMVQLVRRRGHSIVGSVTDGEATVTGTRVDNGDAMTVTWTSGMAERAGLLKKSNWAKYPESMLWARAASQLCRMLFADCFAGATYTPEEIGDEASLPEDEAPLLASSVGEPEGGTLDAPASSVSQTNGDDTPAGTVVESASPTVKLASDARKRKLNVLVGQLRDEGGHITTEQIWRSVGREPTPDADGVVHWRTLRDMLTQEEASELIDRLVKFETKVAAA